MNTITRKITRGLSRSPGIISIIGYSLFILAGAGTLMLPVCLKSGELSFIDALFTSASAVCVTGLTIVDTFSTFSRFGHIVIIILIQTGGIGIMVLSTIFLITIGKKISMTGRTLISDTYSFSKGQEISYLIWNIIKFTVVIESFGAVVLFIRFYPHQELGQALFNAAFHSVSAFCNAGFSLFSGSFTQFKTDWVVNLDICCLIILGGIGFVVLSEVKEKFSFRRSYWSFFSLHTKLVVTGTLALLATGTLCILILEWCNTLDGMAVHNRFLAAFFQAVNARTAGFNTIQIGSMTNESLFIIVILMFIGAAPGSCGGGVKITTFSILILLGVQRFLGYRHLQVYNRRITEESISKAVSLVLISLLVVIITVIMLQQFEIGEISHTASRGMFLEMLFESVSAFGTVGLSTGVTQGLSVAGKALMTIIMFIGRLGPLAIAVSISRQGTDRHFSYAKENIMIG